MQDVILFEVLVLETGELYYFPTRTDTRKGCADIKRTHGGRVRFRVVKITREEINLQDTSLSAIVEG